MPNQRSVNDRGSYSSAVGLIYIFNLIVGTGALAMPKAFGLAGWLISLIVVVLLAVFSYITATFVIESLACASAIKRRQSELISREGSPDVLLVDAADTTDQRNQWLSSNGAENLTDSGEQEVEPLLRADLHTRKSKSVFDIVEVIELGEMASLFFNKVGITLFYICMIIYLYGDLAIYAAAVPKSLRDIVCASVNVSRQHSNQSETSNLCWMSKTLTRSDVYRIFVAGFIVCLGPFVFFSLQKTIFLQIFTTVLRWTSFLMMIVLSVIHLSKFGAKGSPPIADPHEMTNLFGVCVYAFMCHHSLPQMTTPIRDKSTIYRLLAADFSIILGFYLVLCFTAAYTFADIEDLYTLNFGPGVEADKAVTNVQFIEYFLALFPVFSLSSSFPIIAITLRNNLKTLFTLFRQDGEPYHWIVERLVFPIMTLVIPVIIAFSTEDIQLLVGFTGSYAGAAIQYIFPASFVLLARRHVAAVMAGNIRQGDSKNPYESPFRHTIWCVVIFVWSVLSVAFVTANHIMSAVDNKLIPIPTNGTN